VTICILRDNKIFERGVRAWESPNPFVLYINRQNRYISAEGSLFDDIMEKEILFDSIWLSLRADNS
jgi:hypothetical protein